MTDAPDEVFLAVAVVSVLEGTESRPILCRTRPSPAEINMLYVLAEHVSRVISMDDICHRLKMSPPAVKMTVSRLRKKLHYDWTIQAINNQGMRLCYVGSPLADADETCIRFDSAVMRRPYVPRPDDVRDKISQKQVSNESWRHLPWARRGGTPKTRIV
ncbi:MAG: helix-turn-helix domain-containing protein [Elusimicrobia bacterium]|nr:helix-turn-helix domain-containing protein [Elusimicrobiota bacterium]